MNAKTRFAMAGWVALMLGVTVAADEPTQTIHAGPLTFEAPKAWKSETPSSGMRTVQMKVAPATGDTDRAELYTVALPGGGGGVDANVKRWESQFSGDDGQPPKAKLETVQGKNVEVTRVEIAGKYAGMTMPGQTRQETKTKTRLLGAIVMTADTGYFLKLTGPDKTVAGVSQEFDALIKSMMVDQ